MKRFLSLLIAFGIVGIIGGFIGLLVLALSLYPAITVVAFTVTMLALFIVAISIAVYGELYK